MAYLQVDLDAMDAFTGVATCAGISEGEVAIGMLRLWRHCFREKSTHVSRERLRTFFRGNLDEVIQGLEACEFIDRPSNRPDFHVRGSEKRLGVLKVRSDAGKKNVGNLKQYRNKPPADVRQSSGRAPADPPAEHRVLQPTPNTQHPTVNPPNPPSGGAEEPAQGFLLTPEEHHATDTVEEVMRHYLAAMAANGIQARVSEKRRKLIRQRLEEGYSAEVLKRAINGLTWSDHHMRGGFTDLKYALRSTEQIEMMLQREKGAA